MLHIAVIMLKIIGFLLLAVLVLLLLFVSAVLLVPVSWQGSGSFKDRLEGNAKAAWLFHCVSVQVSYQEKAEWSVKIVGIPILKSEKEEFDSAEGFEFAEHSDFAEGSECAEDSDLTEHFVKTKQEENDFEVSVQELPEENRNVPLTKEDTVRLTKKRQQVKRKLFYGKKKLLHGKKRILHLKKKLQDGKRTLLHLKENVQEWNLRWEKLTGFLADEKNQKTFQLLKRQLYRLLRHLFPRKISGELTFGMEDPYTMGQVLSAAAFFYPFYGEKVIITPIFDETVFQGKLQMRGRIRVGTVLFLAGRMLFDKNFRKLVKKILNRGGKKDGR